MSAHGIVSPRSANGSKSTRSCNSAVPVAGSLPPPSRRHLPDGDPWTRRRSLPPPPTRGSSHPRDSRSSRRRSRLRSSGSSLAFPNWPGVPSPTRARSWVRELAELALRTDWELPRHFESARVHALGLEEGKPWLPRPSGQLIVISPFDGRKRAGPAPPQNSQAPYTFCVMPS
jgi:hypothetical protein